MLLNLILPKLSAQSRVIDVGCGLGKFVKALQRHVPQTLGIDPWAMTTKPGDDVFICGEACALPFADKTLDAVFAFDVIEHLDDNLALKEFYRVLKPGGLLVIAVPAFMALWSERDAMAGHLRRYNREGLKQCIQTGGFTIEKLFGYQFFLLPLFALSRLIAGTNNSKSHLAVEEKPTMLLNGFLKLINFAEIKLHPILRPPIGTSLIVVARKSVSRQ